MTAKAEKLNRLVDAIPEISFAAKEGLRDLVEGLSGEKLREETYRVGDRFVREATGVEYILALGDNFKVQAVNLNSGIRRNSGARVLNAQQITERELVDILNSRRTVFIKSHSR